MKWGSRRALAWVLAWAAAWCAPAAAQMQMPGSFAVNERGAATYTIPVRVPPGVAGVEPKLELVYNSQRGNGLLGMGWSLSGLSAITRCPQTLAQDPGLTVSGAVKFDAADRFCLDGQRLMVVAGTYGAAGSEYRTEQESFSKVSAVGGTTANGPEQFVVKTRSGLTMTYGGTTDSRLEAQGKSVVAVWSLSKVSDIKDNYLAITYTEDRANGVSYPARIDYTANAATSLAAANVVYFDYEARPDVEPTYHEGSLSRTTLRLNKVRTATAAGATAVMELRLAYHPAFAERNDSYVQSVQQCGADGGCLPATTWSFAEPAADMTAVVLGDGNALGYWSGYAAAVNQDLHFIGDFSGDGRSDLLYWKSNEGWRVLLNTGSSWIDQAWGDGGKTGYWSGFSGTSNQSFHFTGDFNGDNKTDFMYWESGEGWRVLLSTGSGWNGQDWGKGGGTGNWSGFTETSNQPFHFVGDFNGDGKTDFMHRQANVGWRVLLSTGSGWVGQDWGNGGSTGYWSGFSGTSGQLFHFVGDFNGDGKSDFMYRQANVGWRVLLSTGSGWSGSDWGDGGATGYWANFATQYEVAPASSQTVSTLNPDGTWTNTIVTTPATTSLSTQPFHFVGDFNGDNKTDFMYWQTGVGWRVLLSTGSGWSGSDWGKGSAAGLWDGFDKAISNQRFHFVDDFNADGKSDFFYRQANVGWRVLLSTGTGWIDRAWITGGTRFWVGWNQLATKSSQPFQFVGDFTGQGKADFIYHKGNDGWVVMSSPGLRTPAQITQGLGAGVAITTQTLPQAGTAGYQTSYAAAAPQVVITPPLLVVTETRQTGVPGETRTARYSYDSAVAEIGTGRGFLGFHKVLSKDEEYGTWTQTVYHVDWPFTGLPKATYVTLRQGVEPLSYLVGLSDKQTHYTCQNPATAPETVAPGAGAAALSPGQPGNCVVSPGARYQVWASRSAEQRKDLTGLEVAAQDLPGTRTDVSDMDKYGNAARVRVEALLGDGTASGHYQVTDTLYSNDPANWILGRPLRSSVKAVAP
jgi:hypothetical protein